MKTATVNFKVEPHIKDQAYEIAKVIGIPLGSLLNAYMREFIASQEVHFSVASVRKTRTVQQIIQHLGDEEREEMRQELNAMHLKESFLGENKV